VLESGPPLAVDMGTGADVLEVPPELLVSEEEAEDCEAVVPVPGAGAYGSLAP
jgi:hypothetical protein